MAEGERLRKRAEDSSEALLREAEVRKDAESMLEEANRELGYYKLALDKHAIVSATDSRGVITYVNERFTEVAKYQPEELIGQKHSIMHPPEVYRDMWSTIASGAVWSGDIANKAKDGSIYWVKSTIVPFCDGDGKPFKYVSIRTDITEAKTQEAELLEAKEAAEAANSAKSAFLATMSHEIRTPMNGVIGMTGLLMDTELSEDQRRFTETIRQSGEALMGVINDILDFSKLEAGKMAFERVEFGVPSLVESVVEILSSKASERDVEVSSYIDPALVGLARGDSGRIRQVLMNLVGNAIKFTCEGSVSVVATKSLNGIRFEVRDTGIGIPEEAQGKLFTMFTQVDSSTARKFGGTGLGLAICKKIVDMLGGQIGVVSNPGKGSTFWFDIPAEIVSDKPINILAFSGKKALVVDDNRVNRELVSRQLSSFGMSVDEADSGFAALGRTLTEHYDVVVLDFQMPGMDGQQTLNRMRSTERGGLAPKVVMASSLGGRGILNGSDAQPDAVLVKPVRQAELLHSVAYCLGLDDSAGIPDIEDARDDSAKASHKKLRILVAEDNSVNQQVILGFLHSMGHYVDVVANGAEAVEAVAGIKYDIVLMDMQMPEMDGLEATRRIRAMGSGQSQITVVAMTANAMHGDDQRCYEAGMDGYVTKPITRQKVETALSVLDDRAVPHTLPAADVEAVSDLIDAIGKENFLAAVEGLAEDFNLRIPLLRKASQCSDTASIRAEVHSLKGSAGSMGCIAVVSVLEKIHAGCEYGSDIAKLIEDLASQADRAVNNLREF